MNRSRLKSYAPQARLDFRRAVADRAHKLGIEAGHVAEMDENIRGDYVFIAGRPHPRRIAAARRELERRWREVGFDALIEEAAYTWFNRLMAIRFMELHGYLPHGRRVLSHPDASNPTPQILQDAQHIELPGLDRAQVIALKLDGTRDSELFNLLLLGQCRALHDAMPFLFEAIDDATELLLPDNLLSPDSPLRKLAAGIEESDWQQVEIIGWLYQFYISERKAQVIGKVVAAADIPAATQLFTPNWIVKYMVHNSLGRLWIETYPHSSLRAQLPFFIEAAPQSTAVQEQLGAMTARVLEPEAMTFLDPAVGSGHILVEAYDVFKAIYEERGYARREIPRLILEKNLWGLDIDARAAQMAGFAVTMKARADDRRLLESPLHLHIGALHEGAQMDAAVVARALGCDGGTLQILADTFAHAKTCGSLLSIPTLVAARLDDWQNRLDAVAMAEKDLFTREALGRFAPLLQQAQILARRFDVVVANPPYMGGKGMNATLKSFAAKNFPRSKADLFAMFIERNLQFAKPNGFVAMVTMQSWMFLSSYEALRKWIVEEKNLVTMAHLGARAFAEISGEVVQTTMFAIRNAPLPQYKPVFFRATEGDEINKARIIRDNQNRFDNVETQDFEKIPGSPIAYWNPKFVFDLFARTEKLTSMSEAKSGMSSCNGARFLRIWHEVALNETSFSTHSHEEAKFGRKKWFLYNKGGGSIKWHGFNEFVINWANSGAEIKKFVVNNPNDPNTTHWSRRLFNVEYFFLPGITWSAIGSAGYGVRLVPHGIIPGTGSKTLFDIDSGRIHEIAAFLNSNVCSYFLQFLCPTLNFEGGDVGKLPIIRLSNEDQSIVTENAEEAIEISRADWDAFETSWDFAAHPLVCSGAPSLESSFAAYASTCSARRERLRELETENNRLFIAAYGLQDELSPDVPDAQITLARASREADARRLISYAVGCMMGRYSLSTPGLIYAASGNRDFDRAAYGDFAADADGILPVTERQWFDDDITTRLLDWLETVWGAASLAANTQWLAQSLGAKSGESPVETLRRYFAVEFFKHHLQTYKNRPIYWLLSSGRERAFGALIYAHRYHEGTLARLRMEYAVPLQARFNARLQMLDEHIKSSNGIDKRRLEKEAAILEKQRSELIRFDEELRHMADARIEIDLDDGVRANYGKFGGLVAESRLVCGVGEE